MSDENNKKLESTRRAIDKYCERQLIKERRELGPRRRNSRPEKVTERACLEWMRLQKWQVQIYESKATYSQTARRWINASMQAGVCDCQGTMPSGRSIAIEFKAKGKLATFWRTANRRQQDFILEKIQMNAFAAVVDSADHLADIYNHWQLRLGGGDESAQNYLIEALPASRNRPNLDQIKSSKKLPTGLQMQSSHQSKIKDPSFD